MLWLNLTMGMIGLLSVWMSYKLAGELASRPVALLVAGLLGLNSLLHVMSTLQLSDMPFTLLVVTGLYCLVRGLKGQKWSLEWGTLALFASCWVRVAGVAIAVACTLGLLLERRAASRLRVCANVVALLAGVTGTLALFYTQYQNTLRAEHSLPPASYMAGVHALLDQPVTSLILRALRNAYESAGEIPKFLAGVQSNPLVALAICLSPALVGLGRRLRHREFLIALAVAGYSTGILVNLPAGPRYFLPVAPLLILYYLEGLALLLDWHPRVRRFAPHVLMLFLGVFVALNGLKGLHAQYKNHHVIAQQRADLGTCAQSLRAAVHPGELFLSCDAEWQIAYLSEVPYLQLDRWILAGSLDRDQYLRFLFDQNVRLVIFVPGSLSHYPDERSFETPCGIAVSLRRSRRTAITSCIASSRPCNRHRRRVGPSGSSAEPMNLPSMKIAIIIVTRNHRGDMEKLLPTLAAQTRKDFTVLISDNGSDDGTAGWVRSAHPDVQVIENGTNLGFAEGSNIGFRRALAAGARYVILLNPDTVVDSQWLEQLVRSAESDESVGVCQSKIYRSPASVPPVINTVGNRLHYTGVGWCGHLDEVDRGQFAQDMDIPYASGAAMLVKADVVRDIGVLDPDLFMYHEDLDWSLRAHLRGHRIVLSTNRSFIIATTSRGTPASFSFWSAIGSSGYSRRTGPGSC